MNVYVPLEHGIYESTEALKSRFQRLRDQFEAHAKSYAPDEARVHKQLSGILSRHFEDLRVADVKSISKSEVR